MAGQTDYFFKRTGLMIDGEISLDSVDLQILTLIEQKKSVRQIGKEMAVGSAVLKKKLTELHRKKVIKLVKTHDCMEPAFAETVKKMLNETVGPIGNMIFEDALMKLNLEPDTIPRVIAHDFIRVIVSEFPDETLGLEFKENVLGHVKI